MSCGAWRVFFTVAGATVEVLRIAPGYPHEYLVDSKKTRIADRQAQIAFNDLHDRLLIILAAADKLGGAIALRTNPFTTPNMRFDGFVFQDFM